MLWGTVSTTVVRSDSTRSSACRTRSAAGLGSFSSVISISVMLLGRTPAGRPRRRSHARGRPLGEHSTSVLCCSCCVVLAHDAPLPPNWWNLCYLAQYSCLRKELCRYGRDANPAMTVMRVTSSSGSVGEMREPAEPKLIHETHHRESFLTPSSRRRTRGYVSLKAPGHPGSASVPC